MELAPIFRPLQSDHSGHLLPSVIINRRMCKNAELWEKLGLYWCSVCVCVCACRWVTPPTGSQCQCWLSAILILITITTIYAFTFLGIFCETWSEEWGCFSGSWRADFHNSLSPLHCQWPKVRLSHHTLQYRQLKLSQVIQWRITVKLSEMFPMDWVLDICSSIVSK